MPAGTPASTKARISSAQEAGVSTAWVSLDARDSDPTLFWSYVVAALQKIDPDLGTAAVATLRTAPGALEDAVGALVNDLADRDDIVLVLDDHHVAIPDATGNRRLDTLVNVVATGHAALIFLIPGRDWTLRVNGRACSGSAS